MWVNKEGIAMQIADSNLFIHRSLYFFISGGGDRNRTGVRECEQQDHYECSSCKSFANALCRNSRAKTSSQVKFRNWYL